MREFHAYLDLDAIFTRAPGDVWQRARAEHVLNRNAQFEMFYSKWETVAGRLIVVGIVIALGWFLVAMSVCGTTTDRMALNPFYDPIRRMYAKVRSLRLPCVLHRCVYRLL